MLFQALGKSSLIAGLNKNHRLKKIETYHDNLMKIDFITAMEFQSQILVEQSNVKYVRCNTSCK